MTRPVVAQLLPALNHGGVERGTIEVANHLASNGYKSYVISSGGQLVKELDAKVEHICLEIGKKSISTLFKVTLLKNIFLQNGINIVHARSRLPAWIAYWALKKIKSPKPKFITTVHGLYSVKKYSSIMARGDRVIAVSNTTKSYVEDNYQQYLSPQIDLIYRGIDQKVFPYKLESDELFSYAENFYNHYPELVNSKMVLLPGRLSTLKGLKELEVWLKNTSAKLILTANKDDNKETKQAFQWFADNHVINQVVWAGYQSKIANLYNLVDLVLSPSTRPESFGRTVAESLATGTPVVGYAHGGVKEILEEIFPQGLVEPHNSEQFSERIEALLSRPEIVTNHQPFLLKTMLDQTLNVYKECLNEIR